MKTEVLNLRNNIFGSPALSTVPAAKQDLDKTDDSKLRQSPKFPSKAQTITALIAVAALATIATSATWINYSANHESTDDCYVDGHITNVSSRVAGMVQNVYVQDNQPVKAGDLLFSLDPTDYQVKVQQARAALDYAQKQALAARTTVSQVATTAAAQNTTAQSDTAAAQATIKSAQAQVQQAKDAAAQQQTQIDALQAQRANAALDLKRYSELWSQGAVSRQQLDQSKMQSDVLDAQMRGAKNELSQAQGRITQAEATLAQSYAQLKRSQGSVQTAKAAEQQATVQGVNAEVAGASVAQAEASLKQAELDLAYTQVRAPISGRVGRKSVEIGQRLDVGQATMSVIDDHLWLTANFKETQVGRMHQGQKVEIAIDSFPGEKFAGTVDSLSPASGNKFAMLPADNATGNFTKVVQRIPVKILLSPLKNSQVQAAIAPGMSCEATVDLK